jgi:hypothetical protein
MRSLQAIVSQMLIRLNERTATFVLKYNARVCVCVRVCVRVCVCVCVCVRACARHMITCGHTAPHQACPRVSRAYTRCDAVCLQLGSGATTSVFAGTRRLPFGILLVCSDNLREDG